MAKKEKAKEVAVITPEQKVAEIAKDLKKFEKKAEPFAVIKTQDDYKEVTAFVVEIKGRINRIKDLKTEYVKPFKDQIKKLESLFNDPLKHYEEIEVKVKSSMSAFLREQEAVARKEEERLRIQREKQDAKKAEPNPAPLPSVERADPTVRTEAGKATAKKVWKFEIEAYSKLPQSVIDEVLYQAQQKGIHEQVIRKLVLAGQREIAGVRIYEDFDLSVSA